MRKLSNEELNRVSVEEFKNTKKNPFVILLDNVRSLHNVGATFRTADAFLAEKIYLCGITGTPPNREITKTALGATESVDWEYAQDSVKAAQQIQEAGYQLIVIEQVEKSISLQDMPFMRDAKYCFVFGNEVFGVNENLVEIANSCVEIPQFGTKHSLNISVSVGVVIWDYISKSII